MKEILVKPKSVIECVIFRYKIIDSAGNRFAIQKDLFGVYELFTTDTILDYESQTNYTIVVETTDNGRPAMSHQGSIIVQVC